jgi:hypothetical protein
MLISELEKRWNEAAVSWFEVLSQNVPEGTEKTHDKPQSRLSMSGPDSNAPPPKTEALSLGPTCSEHSFNRK